MTEENLTNPTEGLLKEIGILKEQAQAYIATINQLKNDLYGHNGREGDVTRIQVFLKELGETIKAHNEKLDNRCMGQEKRLSQIEGKMIIGGKLSISIFGTLVGILGTLVGIFVNQL